MNGQEFKKYVGQSIARIRKYKGMSQEEMSEAIDISPNSYSRIERGQNLPSADNFAKIIDVLKIEPKDLFGFPNEENDEKIRSEIYRKLDILKNDRDKMVNIWFYLNSIL